MYLNKHRNNRTDLPAKNRQKLNCRYKPEMQKQKRLKNHCREVDIHRTAKQSDERGKGQKKVAKDTRQ